MEHLIIGAGGILGTNTGVVENCFNLGNIFAIQLGSRHVFAGGVCGYSETIIRNCYNIGQVQGSKTNSTPYVGGAIAYTASGVEKCANIGSILYEGTSAKYVGTIAGALSGTQTNSYYLNNTELNGIGRNYSEATQPTKVETIEEMPTVLSVVGDAFKADTNNINGGYPLLKWQSSTTN